ncbi:MAG TPA: MFS transporter [Spirochaetes bacterium]|nr:MFS transporter [Spirochaetota bacterium]
MNTQAANRRSVKRDLVLFSAAVALYGFSQSIVESTLNNFLDETFSITDIQRGILELPREMPGFLVVFMGALFFFLCARRLGALAHLFAAAGILMMGLFSPSFPVMLVWLFIYSTGIHIFLPMISSIGMEFAEKGKTGSRLGQLNGVMNFAAIAGSFIVFLGFRFLDFTFTLSFALSAAGFLAASALMGAMKPDRPRPAMEKFILRKEYRLFYWLNILFGTRKQIFITFAPWVLVTVYAQKTQTVATLLTIGGIIGIFFKPMLGRAIDRLGERAILMAEAAVLVFVCAGYGLSRRFSGADTALYIACACFVIDHLLISASMARATYLGRIALRPGDISPTLAMGVSIDHAFSIGIALAGGLLWHLLGYEYVFLLGALIALVNLASASRIRVPSNSAPALPLEGPPPVT